MSSVLSGDLPKGRTIAHVSLTTVNDNLDMLENYTIHDFLRTDNAHPSMSFDDYGASFKDHGKYTRNIRGVHRVHTRISQCLMTLCDNGQPMSEHIPFQA
jgi:hypothetical protein